MSGPVLAVVLVAMALGLLGTVLPVLPGLPLIWGAALAGFISEGFGPTAWITMTALTLLMVGGVAAKYVLPSRTGGETLARKTLLWAALGGAVGFFVIPVVGFAIGGVAGLYLGEVQRTGDGDYARRSTVAALKRFGVGVLVEIAAGLSMVIIFLMSRLVG